MIIKRIYFPGNTYGQNNIVFKNILAKHGLIWAKSALQTYTSEDGKTIRSGIYYTPDQIHKLLCIYEGNDKPATFFYKTVGTGGNFLIDINSFCSGLGCIIDNKNEEYMNNITLRLHDHKSIDIFEEIKKEREKDFEKDGSKRLNNEKKKLSFSDIKMRMIVRRFIRRYIIDSGDSLRKRGISVEVALFFKKKDLCESVRWASEKWVYRRYD